MVASLSHRGAPTSNISLPGLPSTFVRGPSVPTLNVRPSSYPSPGRAAASRGDSFIYSPLSTWGHDQSLPAQKRHAPSRSRPKKNKEHGHKAKLDTDRLKPSPTEESEEGPEATLDTEISKPPSSEGRREGDHETTPDTEPLEHSPTEEEDPETTPDTEPSQPSSPDECEEGEPETTLHIQPPTALAPEPTYTLATQMIVGAPPSICTASTYSYAIKASVQTGYIRIGVKDTDWGTPDTIWSIHTGAGVELVDMKAKCQGSGCTGINGNGNKEFDGEMKRRKDGSWYMKVVPNMQHALMISGLLRKIGRVSFHHRIRRDDQNYPLRIQATPPCGLPIAKKCSDGDYTGNPKQWEAHKMDEFMEKYLNDNDIKDLDTFRMKAVEDFIPPWAKKDLKCDISLPGYSCDLPHEPEVCDRWRSSRDEARGLMLAQSVMAFGDFLQNLYNSVDRVMGSIGSTIELIVHNIWSEAAEQSWHQAVDTVAAALGFVVLALSIVMSLFPLGAWAGMLLRGVTLLSKVAGVAAKATDAIDEPKEGDSQFAKAATDKDSAEKMLKKIQKSFVDLMKNKDLGQEGLSSMFQGGIWTSDAVYDLSNTQGFGYDMTGWFEKFMVTNSVAKAITDNDGYIVFIAYGKDVLYNGEKRGFDKDFCIERFQKNPSWKYAVVCDMDFGPDGAIGMSLFVRPSSQGSSSDGWMKKSITYNDHEITAPDVMASTIWGFQMKGYGYTILHQDWTQVLKKNGAKGTVAMFASKSLRLPGLYKIAVCVVKDLAYIPGIRRVMKDWKDDHWNYDSAPNPCSCADYEYTSPDGKRGKFVDHVSDAIKDSVTKDCKISGNRRA